MELKADPRNYREHSDRNKELINKSLKDYGAGRSILIDGEDVVIAGNGVYEQAKKLNIPIRIVESDGKELVVVKQTDLNNERIKEYKGSTFICDDGQNVAKHIKKNSQDLLFSCPPYFDLEHYSDLKNDASNQGEYSDFIKIIDNAFTDSIKALKKNRFAVIVVGDIRNKSTGYYYRFPDDIKDIFQRNGMHLYNEIVLIESIGASRFRTGVMNTRRKLIKTHQNVLVFFNGNHEDINDIFPNLDLSDIILNQENESEDLES